jgi:hypothetical protein
LCVKVGPAKTTQSGKYHPRAVGGIWTFRTLSAVGGITREA